MELTNDMGRLDEFRAGDDLAPEPAYMAAITLLAGEPITGHHVTAVPQEDESLRWSITIATARHLIRVEATGVAADYYFEYPVQPALVSAWRRPLAGTVVQVNEVRVLEPARWDFSLTVAFPDGPTVAVPDARVRHQKDRDRVEALQRAILAVG